MPNVGEIIKDHVTVEVRCITGFISTATSRGCRVAVGSSIFSPAPVPQQIASPALLRQITDAFKTRLRAWTQQHQIPWIEFRKGERKGIVVQRYRDRFPKRTGVVLIGVAHERASGWTATKRPCGRRFIEFVYSRKSVYVNHYYIYVLDPAWGPAFIKICGYAPYTLKICLNGHEWAKRQLSARRLRCTALDNGFLHCARPDLLEEVCNTLDAAAIEQFFARWQQQIPFPLIAAHAARGFTYHLSILQAEVSRTQVFDRPLRGREFFETVLRENLDLGRPDTSSCSSRAASSGPPGRFTTHVITKGVNPSLHIAYKHCRIKQYLKAERALRTETTFNDTYDFDIGRRLSNLPYLRTLGDHINRRVLKTERLAHDRGLAPAQLADLVQPTRTPAGQPAPALKFGQPRVTALLNALCHFLWTADGVTNAQLRSLIASPLGTPYTTRQMGYGLRRLLRKGLLTRLDHEKRYVLTPYGRRVALFLTNLIWNDPVKPARW